MNAVERNIKALHERTFGKIIGWNDNFYKDFQWTARTYEKKLEVNRWIDWINSFFTMLSNMRVEYIPIFNTSGTAICDSDGNQLYYIKRIYEVN